MNDDVREVVGQWVARAEADWQAAQALAEQFAALLLPTLHSG
jgi:hypothetical protein